MTAALFFIESEEIAMCTLALSDMGELRDEWLRAPAAKASATLPVARTLPATAHAPPTVAAAAIPTAAALAIAYLTEVPAARLALSAAG